MNNTNKYFNILLLLAFAALGTACSGGGGGSSSSGTTFNGETSPAAIDADNVEAIGTASGEAVLKANSSNSLPGGLSVSTSADLDQVNSIVLSTVNVLTLPAAAEDIPGVCDSGTASISDFPAEATGPQNFTITYNNCVISFDGNSKTFDGKVIFKYDDFGNTNAGFTITYINFKVIDSISGTTTINLVVDCTDSFNCTFNSDFVGSDGVTHRVTNFSINGNASSGFNGSATFLHGTFGEVTMTISGITYSDSCGSIPNGGSITFASSNGSTGSITFSSDCTAFGSWNDGNGNFGSF